MSATPHTAYPGEMLSGFVWRIANNYGLKLSRDAERLAVCVYQDTGSISEADLILIGAK